MVEDENTTTFHRELTYAPSGVWFKILDFLFMHRRMEARVALTRLKECLEQVSTNDTGSAQGANRQAGC